jgi:hypothetical protein
MADARDTREEDYEEDDGPRQTVRLMVEDIQPEEVGPFFPSGMSAPEAALAGATAEMTDEQRERFEAGRQARDVDEDV